MELLDKINFIIAKKKHGRTKPFKTLLPSYSPISIFVRFIAVSIVAIMVMQYMIHANGMPPGREEVKFVDYVTIILSFLLLSESLIITDNILEYFYPVPEKLPRRVAIMAFMSIVLILAVYIFIKNISPRYSHPKEMEKSIFFMAIALGLVFVTMLSQVLLIIRFTEKWIHTQKVMGEMKREKLKMDYNILQDQLNPHFLFNNLSVLKSLIIYDTETAVTFTEDFTDVYRYVLQSKNKMTVNLKDEVEFLYAYIGLHQERLGEGLQVNFDIDIKSTSKDIAPLTAQLLVENAIKHNIASKESPLSVRISTDEEYLYISNNLQKKETSYSTKTGLNNLWTRYKMLTDKEVGVEETESEFTVKVPLI